MILLDTHVLLWWLAGNPLLNDRAASTIGNSDIVYVSAATVWEAQIKAALGKLTIPASLPDAITGCGFHPLSVTVNHAAAIARLPLLHKDPFDRLLLAQAQEEKLTFVTHDRRLSRYDVSFLWT